jgi:hypothetical protein
VIVHVGAKHAAEGVSDSDARVKQIALVSEARDADTDDNEWAALNALERMASAAISLQYWTHRTSAWMRDPFTVATVAPFASIQLEQLVKYFSKVELE